MYPWAPQLDHKQSESKVTIVYAGRTLCPFAQTVLHTSCWWHLHPWAYLYLEWNYISGKFLISASISVSLVFSLMTVYLVLQNLCFTSKHSPLLCLCWAQIFGEWRTKQMNDQIELDGHLLICISASFNSPEPSSYLIIFPFCVVITSIKFYCIK